MASDLVQMLTERAAAKVPKVQTTIRLDRRIFERLKAQEKKWDASMSFIIEEAVRPVLDELERAQLVKDGDVEDT